MNQDIRFTAVPNGIAWHALPIDAITSLLVTNTRSGLAGSDIPIRRQILRRRVVDQRRSPSRATGGKTIFLVAVVFFVALAVLATIEVWWSALLIFVLLLTFAADLRSLERHHDEQGRAARRQLRECPARIMRDGRMLDLRADELVPGDIMVIEGEDVVPADGRLFFAEGLSCDEASLTRDSTPVPKSIAAVSTNAPLARQSDMIFMGTKVLSGKGRAIVTGTWTDAPRA